MKSHFAKYVAVVAGVAMLNAGCSWFLVRGPPPAASKVAPAQVECTSSVVAPVADSVLAIALLGAGTAATAFGSQNRCPAGRSIFDSNCLNGLGTGIMALGVFGVMVGAPFAISALGGYSMTAECRDLAPHEEAPAPAVNPPQTPVVSEPTFVRKSR